MTRKGILMLDEKRAEHEEKIRKIAPDYTIVRKEEDGFTDDFKAEEIEIIYGWGPAGKEVLELENNSVKWVQAASAGVDFLDFDRLKKQGVRVTNASGIHKIGIAESVIGMILYQSRGIRESVNAQSNKEWIKINQLFELKGQTIMIVGTGHIGQEVARLSKAFVMKTVGINRSGRPVDYIDELHTQDDLLQHVPEADIIVNILPLTEQTKHLYNKEFFRQMKQTGLFINVGRGPSVKTEDLIDALNEGQLAFAGLDVVEEEPLPSNSPLWDMENVLLTPHISGVLADYMGSVFAIFEENLVEYVQTGNLLVNEVDLDRGY